MAKKDYEEINRRFEQGEKWENYLFQVAEANKGLVVKQVKDFSAKCHLSEEDRRELLELGEFSLYNAVMKFNPRKAAGAPFSSYASKVIYHDLIHALSEIIEKSSLVQVSPDPDFNIEDSEDFSLNPEERAELNAEMAERRKQIAQWISEMKGVKKKDLWTSVFLSRLGLMDGKPQSVNELKRTYGMKRSEIKNITSRCMEMVMEKNGVKPSKPENGRREMLEPRDWHLLRFIIKCNRKEIYPNRQQILQDEELSNYFFSVDTVSDAVKRLERIKGCNFEKVGRHQGFKILNSEEVTQLSEKDLMISSVIYLLLKEYANTPYKKVFQSIWQKFRESQGVIAEDMSFLEKEPLYVVTNPLPRINDGVFNVIYKACRKKKTLAFEYSSVAKGKSLHEADPYLISCQKGSWYVLAWQHDVEDFRWFSFSRFSSVPVIKGKYIPREDFNRADWLDLKQGILWTKDRIKVKLLVHKEIATYFSERKWYEDQTEEKNEDGTMILRFTTNHSVSPAFPQDLVRFIMEWSPHIEVLEPPELRSEVRALIKKLYLMYE